MAARGDKDGSLVRVRSVARLPERAADAHKGDFGRVLVMGGSLGMAGAPALVGLAALRAGAGLVVIAVPQSIQATVAGICPCATTIGLPETASGQIDPEKARKLFTERGMLAESERGSPPDVLATGPGVGGATATYGAAFWDLINAFRNGPLVPAVIDADALNLAKRSTPQSPGGWDGQYHFRTIITPHPGEMGRLHEVSAGEVQADREGFAVCTARMMAGQRDESDYRPVVGLKGAGTVVTDGQRIYVNRTGNAGMATGGSGDVLAGVIAGLVGQGMEPFDAAATGVHVHGLAGDLAAKRRGQVSLIATDIIEGLSEAFVRLEAKGER
jgi:ADP-dependent NAD(P)H-hydrate dehydratase